MAVSPKNCYGCLGHLPASTMYIFVTVCTLLLVRGVGGEFKAAEKHETSHTPVTTKPSKETQDNTLGLDDYAEDRRKANKENDDIMRETLQALDQIYKYDIKPLEDAYRFADLNKDALLEAEITAKPLILFVGPWSTGKSSLINYLLGIEESKYRLHTGAEPTTSDFVILQHGKQFRTTKGMQLVTSPNQAYASLEAFGQNFLEKLVGYEVPSSILELVTLVDTPGIIENKKQQERGYPFNQVIQWFLQRASKIFLVFDPTKLDMGSELESIFAKLKGYEGKVKILLNKADIIPQQELMRVYGALFWSLAPLVHAVEPPRVYVGSFWSDIKKDHPMLNLFKQEEETLINDLKQAIENQVENKIGYVRRHALQVRLHALTVDSYLQSLQKHSGCFICSWKDDHQTWQMIIQKPGQYGVYENLLKHADISRYDVPKPEVYSNFFYDKSPGLFSTLDQHCHWFSGCLERKIKDAITQKLPDLLNNLQLNIKYDQSTKTEL